MPISTGAFAKLMRPGLDKIWWDAYQKYPAEYKKCFTETKSNLGYEEDVMTMGFGQAVVKPEGSSINYDEARQLWVSKLTHQVWAKGFVITKEMISDNQYKTEAPRRASDLAFAMQQAKETNGANIFNRAFNSSYTGGDGKELCANDHPLGGGGTFSNIPSSSADLSETALEQAIIDIGGWTDENGHQISVMADHLLVHRSDAFNAERILKSALQNDSANNAINALKSSSAIPGGYSVNHYLTDSDAWFVVTNIPSGRGLQLKQSWTPAFENDGDFDTDNARFKGTERYIFGWFNPRCVYGSAGA